MSRRTGIKPQTIPLEVLGNEALTTCDGHRLRELIVDIGSHSGDPTVRCRHLTQIAEKFPYATHLITGTITAMVANQLPGAREFVRRIMDAPVDREKDLIVARAATALLELNPIEDQDVPRLAHALIRALPAVRGEVARGLAVLSSQHAGTLLIQARRAEQTPTMQLFLRKLEDIIIPPTLSLPPRAAPPANNSVVVASTPSTSSTEPPEEIIAPYVKSAERKRNGLCLKTIGTLTSFVTDEARAMTDSQLHHACSKERDCGRLVAALAECVLRNGPAAAMPYRNRFVWLGSHPSNEHTRRAEVLHSLIF